ncbi:hypothetical protein GCM10009654_36820 [Streptomyces hebeiensis]|uniref:Uncharacterized protein n=1 Tax=Streptomyces hebeiensis TaxID=229486 RepID=A0ABN1UWK5_9ACTN
MRRGTEKPQPAGHGEQRVEYVRDGGGGRTGQPAGPRDPAAAAGRDAKEGAPGHGCLLTVLTDGGEGRRGGRTERGGDGQNLMPPRRLARLALPAVMLGAMAVPAR